MIDPGCCDGWGGGEALACVSVRSCTAGKEREKEKGRGDAWIGQVGRRERGEREFSSDVASAVGGVGCGFEVLEGFGGVIAWCWC